MTKDKNPSRLVAHAMPNLSYTMSIELANFPFSSGCGDTQLTLDGEKRKYSTRCVPDYTIGRQRRGAIPWPINVDGIQNGRSENANVAPGKRNRGKHGTDPMNARTSGPCEPKQANHQPEAPHHCRVQAMLRCDRAAPAIFMALQIFLSIPQSVRQDSGHYA